MSALAFFSPPRQGTKTPRRRLGLGPDFLRRLENMAIAAGRKFAAGPTALRAGAVRGGRNEFIDHRAYAPGDDLRDLDWPLYGRSNSLFVKVYGAERAKRVEIALDLSASMRVDIAKEIFACRLAAALAHVALAAGDEVFMIAVGAAAADCASLKPQRGLRASRTVINWLEELPAPLRANWQALARCLCASPRQPGTLIAISDFWDDGAVEALAPLARGRQAVALLRVLSGKEISPSWRNNVRLADVESGEEVSLRLTARDIDAYRAAVQNHIHSLAERATRQGMIHRLCQPEQPFLHAVFALLRSGLLR